MLLGTITSRTANVGATLTIDGETSPTTKAYMWLDPYYPEIGDRVLIAEISGSYVVLGKVVNNFASSRVRTLRNAMKESRGNIAFGTNDAGDLFFGIAPLDGSSYTLRKVTLG